MFAILKSALLRIYIPPPVARSVLQPALAWTTITAFIFHFRFTMSDAVVLKNIKIKTGVLKRYLKVDPKLYFS